MSSEKNRLYLKRGRWYADLRDLGGGLKALRPEGTKHATTDKDAASVLLAEVLKKLRAEKEASDQDVEARVFGIERDFLTPLGAFAAEHLDRKAEDGEGVVSWLAQAQTHLERAVEYFGETADLKAITPVRLNGYVDHLRKLDNGRGGKLGETSVRKHLNSLSNMFKRAVSDEKVTINPVGAMYSKPTETMGEADYLEPEEAALLLESARIYQPDVTPVKQKHGGSISAKPNPHVYPILATLLLTGMRKSEALGLEVDDVSFRLGKIYVRPNQYRRLKTKKAKRTIPLWPQLRAILEAYMIERERSGGLGSLLFPSVRPPRKKRPGNEDGELMIKDLRKALNAISKRAGFPPGHVHLHQLRHTYTAARIQTLDRGAPIALFTVARELGHSSTDMIEDVYGHLHDRAVLGGSEFVEFRVEAFGEALSERLAAMGVKA